MKVALFEINSWIGAERYLIKARSVRGLLTGLQKHQNLECLVMYGDEEDADELAKLSGILHAAKRSALTLEQLALLDVHLSIGNIKCIGVADDDDAEGAERLAAMANQ